MGLTLHLDDAEDASLLTFLIDSTIERWTDERPSQVNMLAFDPTFKTPEELLVASGDLSDQIDRLKRIRAMMGVALPWQK
jgi:hypothetical protein